MERLTTREEYPHGAEGKDINHLTGQYCRGKFEATAVVERLAEYENAEEEGLLRRFPCKVGDIVYYISESIKKQGRKKELISFVDEGIVDNITFGSTMTPQITVCNNENTWTTFDGEEDFGKIVFLTRPAAEEALKRMEGEK